MTGGRRTAPASRAGHRAARARTAVVRAAVAGALALLLPPAARAGPPYLTDDPEPVEYRHWEVYLASIDFAGPDGQWTGTAPHVEVNYGVVPDVQLHVLAPMAYARTPGGPTTYGYGDTELGVKWRFVEETDSVPMVGIFPLVELPTGDASRGLGNGVAQLFLPVWVQKSFGPWTTYGGGGFWLNPGTGNRNYWFAGWLLQRRLAEWLDVGGELTFNTARRVDASAEVRFDVGVVVDLSSLHHLLASGGTTIGGSFAGQFYVGWQLTFGPADAR